MLVLMLACSSQEDRQQTIKIGGVYALTGKAASFGKEVKNGVDSAVDAINEKGGIEGRKLLVVSEDTQSDPKHAVSAFEKLITVDRVPAAVGFITSSGLGIFHPYSPTRPTLINQGVGVTFTLAQRDRPLESALYL
jgi:hypothetical protein